jgi:hypothetical protein
MSQGQKIDEQEFVSDLENIAFSDTLVCAITGYHIAQLPEDQRISVIESCTKVFTDYIIDYVTEKFGAKQAWRLRAAQVYNGDQIFNKFPELKDNYWEAYQAFVTMLGEEV